MVTLGVCVGFLPWNVHPARTFMGDTGALLLGLMMASSTIAVGGQSDDSFTGQSWFFFAPLVIPLPGVRIVDTPAEFEFLGTVLHDVLTEASRRARG